MNEKHQRHCPGKYSTQGVLLLLFLSKISVSVLHLRYLLSKICLEKLSYGHILKLFLYEKCYLAK